MRILLSVVAFVLASGQLAGQARAEKVAVLDIAVSGISNDARARFEARFVEGLAAAGYDVVPRDQVLEAMVTRDAPEGCAFGPCLARLGEQVGAPLGFVGRVAAEGSSYSFVLTLVDTKTGVPIRQLTDSCGVCTVDEALAGATLAAVSLGTSQGTGPDAPTGPVDGAAGASPGKPTVEAAPATPSRVPFLVSLGLGLTAVAAGALLVSRDEDPEGWITLGAGAGVGLASTTFLLFSL